MGNLVTSGDYLSHSVPLIHQPDNVIVCDADHFVFCLPNEARAASSILLKPNCGYLAPHPVTTSPHIMCSIVEAILSQTDATIVVLEGSCSELPAKEIYRYLGYDFPHRVELTDVSECHYMELANPLAKPFVLSTIWVPEIVIRCEYRISIPSLKVYPECPSLSIKNLIGLLPPAVYGGSKVGPRSTLHTLGIDEVIADLYFTLPFDLGIIDGCKRLIGGCNGRKERVEEWRKIYIGDPLSVDTYVLNELDVHPRYLRLIQSRCAERTSNAKTSLL